MNIQLPFLYKRPENFSGLLNSLLIIITIIFSIYFSSKSNKTRSSERNIFQFVSYDSSDVNVMNYGAIGDGIHDDTHNIQEAIDFATTTHRGVFLPKGKKYLVSTIEIKNGIKEFICDGIIVGSGKSIMGIVVLGSISTLQPVNKCLIHANIDMSNGDIFGIHAFGCTNCTFDGNYIFGVTNNSKKYCILLEKNSNNNRLINNEIDGFERPSHLSVGIGILGEGDAYAGFFNNGNITNPTAPCVNNIIEHNKFNLGRYAIDLIGCEGCMVKDNYCFKQHHRSIYMADATNRCTIANNQCIGFGSSAILLGYGANNNLISHNICKQIMGYNPPGAEAAINITSGAYGNRIIGNIIETSTNYGVFLGINMINNLVDSNTISGYYLAGIALENEITKPLPPGALYSRPNFASPLIGNKWASKNTEGNVITNNIIGNSYKGRNTAAIYISEIGLEYKTENNVVENNIINNEKAENPIYIFESSKNNFLNNKIANNKTSRGALLKEHVAQ